MAGELACLRAEMQKLSNQEKARLARERVAEELADYNAKARAGALPDDELVLNARRCAGYAHAGAARDSPHRARLKS